MGRKLPKLMEIEDPQERVNAALKVFDEVKLPVDEWSKWLNPLIDYEDETYTIDYVKNDQGLVTELKLVAV